MDTFKYDQIGDASALAIVKWLQICFEVGHDAADAETRALPYATFRNKCILLGVHSKDPRVVDARAAMEKAVDVDLAPLGMTMEDLRIARNLVKHLGR